MNPNRNLVPGNNNKMTYMLTFFVVNFLAEPRLALKTARSPNEQDTVVAPAPNIGRWLSHDAFKYYTTNLGPSGVKNAYPEFAYTSIEDLLDMQICPSLSHSTDQCLVPPTFSLAETDRNALLGRPCPATVRMNIEKATRGELSSIEDLVAKAIANLRNLNALSDDELTVLASNFHLGKAGWVTGTECGIVEYGAWPAEFLIPEDEQIAVAAAWLHVVTDDGYFTRREEEFREALRQAQDNLAEEKGSMVKAKVELFKKRVRALDKCKSLAVEDWQAQYHDLVTALREALHKMVAAELGELKVPMISKLEALISNVEDEMDEEMFASVFERVPMKPPGTGFYFAEQQLEIMAEFPGIRRGHMFRIIQNRWENLSFEKKELFLDESR